jgi:5-methylcytosine-specific restriction endonuclease McrA
MDNFYKTNTWYKARSKTKAKWQRENKPCYYCQEPLDWESPYSVIVDHIKNRKQYPELALHPANLCVVHHACNTKKAAYIENNTRPRINENGFPDSWN